MAKHQAPAELQQFMDTHTGGALTALADGSTNHGVTYTVTVGTKTIALHATDHGEGRWTYHGEERYYHERTKTHRVSPLLGRAIRDAEFTLDTEARKLATN